MENQPQAEYSAALVAAIGELQNVAKTASNPYFKSKYAPLDAIVDATRPVLAKHGLAIQQMPIFVDGTAGVETTIIHKSGFFTSSTLLLPIKDQSPQGVGGAITYARRYALAAVVGLATEDDLDGNEHLGNKPTEAPRPAIAKVLDKATSIKPSGSASQLLEGVLPTQVKVAAKSKEGSAKVWTLYSIEFNHNGKMVETMTFDEKFFTLATELGKAGTLVNAGIAAGKKDPTKWELVSITANEDQNK
jgi:hypothetical protein